MYSVCNRTWFKTSNCPHFTHFILFQMALNLIKIPFSGTSPAFGKGPSQSDSPRNSSSHWLGAGFFVFGRTCTFYQFPPLLCSSFSSAWVWAVEPTPAWSSTLLSSQANNSQKSIIWASVLQHEPVLLSLLDALQQNHIFKQNSPQNQERDGGAWQCKMQLLRKLRKTLDIYFPTAAPLEKVDLKIKSADMKELTRKSVFFQGKVFKWVFTIMSIL